MIYYPFPITHLENEPNSSAGKFCLSFHVFFFSLICISVYGKEHNYEQQTINLWEKMDSVAYLDSASMNINRRMTSGHCCWIDDCNWWTSIDAFIHDKACVWLAVLKYHLPEFIHSAYGVPDSYRPMRKPEL